MLDSLKEVGRNVGREINRAWETVAEGWRELVSRSGNALTHFSRRSAAEGGGEASDGRAAGGLPASSPRWGLLAGEVEETDKELVVRVEVPGLEKDDCRISIEGNVLYLSGEKRFERESGDSTYHVTERAYGMFQRTIPLPCRVDPDQADARYRNGVLTVRLHKIDSGRPRYIPVS